MHRKLRDNLETKYCNDIIKNMDYKCMEQFIYDALQENLSTMHDIDFEEMYNEYYDDTGGE